METVVLGLYFEDLAGRAAFQYDLPHRHNEPHITKFSSTARARVDVVHNPILPNDSDIRPAVAGRAGLLLREGLRVQSTIQHTGFAFFAWSLVGRGPVVSGIRSCECDISEARHSNSGRAVARPLVRVFSRRRRPRYLTTPIAHGECR